MRYILGLPWDNGKENGTYYKGYIGVICGIYWAYIGIMEKRMETTLRVIYIYVWDMLGLYWDNDVGLLALLTCLLHLRCFLKQGDSF